MEIPGFEMKSGIVVVRRSAIGAAVVIVPDTTAMLAEFINIEVPGHACKIRGNIAGIYAFRTKIIIMAGFTAEIAALVISSEFEVAGFVDFIFEGGVCSKGNGLLCAAEG